MRLSASLASAPLTNLAQTVQDLESAGIDYLHFDIEDGSFGPCMNLGTRLISQLRPLSRHIMSSISKTKLAHILCCLSLSILGTLVLADVNATAYEGKIFINLYDSDNFSEYELAAGNLVKTIDGKVSRFEKDCRTYSTSWTEGFQKAILFKTYLQIRYGRKTGSFLFSI